MARSCLPPARHHGPETNRHGLGVRAHPGLLIVPPRLNLRIRYKPACQAWRLQLWLGVSNRGADDRQRDIPDDRRPRASVRVDAWPHRFRHHISDADASVPIRQS
jgi:hypothetical protein